MSYILDALRKSEQERGHGNIPGVQTVHSSSLNYSDDKKAYWPYILIIAAILNIAAISYFIFDKKQSTSNPVEVAQNANIKNNYKETKTDDLTLNVEQTKAIEETTAAPLVINKNKKREPIKAAAVTVNAIDDKPSTTPAIIENHNKAIKTKDTATDNKSKKYQEQIIDFYNLPETIKRQLPTITISAHIYSSNPLQRSIVINNNFLEEGEYIMDNLILHEITSSGAIFNFNGTLFSYPVVSSWQ